MSRGVNKNAAQTLDNDQYTSSKASAAAKRGGGRPQVGQKHHLASLTLSNQTAGHQLYDELESICRHNEEWRDEQLDREKVLREMA